jgi:hypothetical protein
MKVKDDYSELLEYWKTGKAPNPHRHLNNIDLFSTCANGVQMTPYGKVLVVRLTAIFLPTEWGGKLQWGGKLKLI